MRAKALPIGPLVLLALVLTAPTALAAEPINTATPAHQRHAGSRGDSHRDGRQMDERRVGDDAVVAVRSDRA